MGYATRRSRPRCLGEIENGTAVVALGDAFAGLGGDEGGVDDLKVAGAADALGVDGGDCVAFAFDKQAGVIGEEIFFDLRIFRYPCFLKVGEFIFALIGTGMEDGNFFVHDGLGLGEQGFGSDDIFATLVGLFHQLEFLGFEFVDHFLVADYFSSKFLVFVVLFRLELLNFKLLDGGFSGAAIEIDIFRGNLVLLVGRFRGGESGGIICETLLGEILLFGNPLQLFMNDLNSLIEVLNLDELLNVFPHALGIAGVAQEVKEWRSRVSFSFSFSFPFSSFSFYPSSFLKSFPRRPSWWHFSF